MTKTRNAQFVKVYAIVARKILNILCGNLITSQHQNKQKFENNDGITKCLFLDQRKFPKASLELYMGKNRSVTLYTINFNFCANTSNNAWMKIKGAH